MPSCPSPRLLLLEKSELFRDWGRSPGPAPGGGGLGAPAPGRSAGSAEGSEALEQDPRAASGLPLAGRVARARQRLHLRASGGPPENPNDSKWYGYWRGTASHKPAATD
jgi:hypothetical protein